MTNPHRCEWANGSDIYESYHDQEWGVPCFDSQKLFEFLILESAQAGLSWITILKKRHHYQSDFYDYNPDKIARMTQEDIENLIQNSGIVRNRKKIESAINNAQRYLAVVESGVSFSDFIWQFVDHKPVINAWKRLSEVPASTEQSEHMSKHLKKAGFNFVGPTICYAFMQAVGMVNDHTVDCFRYQECIQLAKAI